MNIRTQTVDIVTSSLNAFSKTYQALGPLLLQVVYAVDSDISSAADLTITDDVTGMILLSAANFGSTAGFTKLPRRLIHDAADGTESTGTYDYQAVNPQVTVAVANATAQGQTGTLYLVYG